MSKGHSVEKIGGTSMAATEDVVNNVLIGGRKGADLYGRIFVVSAYAGITDLLLEHKKSGEPGVFGHFVSDDPDAPWQEALDGVRAAMRAHNADMFVDVGGRSEADEFIDARIDDMRTCLEDLDRLRRHGQFLLTEPLATVREMLACLGEAHSAHSTALLLRGRGANAAFVDLTGWGDAATPTLDERIGDTLSSIDVSTVLPIVTGYAASKEGTVRRYDRGYSEIIFSRAAVLTGAREAIIHKEFHLSSADPKLVGPENARKIGRTNYDVADQLANLGMEAIHPGAGRGLRQADIPLRVRNTFERDDSGTLICGDYVSDKPRVEIITGLRSLFALEFFEQDMVGEKGYDVAILDTLTKNKAWIVSKSSNANTITHYLSSKSTAVRRVIAELQDRFPAADVSAHLVAMVSIIGSDISEPGLVAKAMTALSDAGIEVLGLQHQIRNVDVQFLVKPDDFDAAVRELHDALIISRAVPTATCEAA
ncbi:MAG: aspartate kinase [Parvibaculaceae bacterium]